MHIDSYQFGKIVIDGRSYSSDVIIVGGFVNSKWWRKQGHLLCAEDIGLIIEARPSVLVVGCGASGLMEVTEETRGVLEETGIRLESYGTKKAVKRFNELLKSGTNAAAAFHLTC